MTMVMECPVTEPQRRGRRAKRPRSEQHFPRVAEALRAIRQQHDLTQEEMAPILGITFAGYRPYERGERELTHSQIEMIAAALGVPVSDITGRLWPDDARLVETRFSHDVAEIHRQVDALPVPDEVKASILRGFLQSIEVMHAASTLARRN